MSRRSLLTAGLTSLLVALTSVSAGATAYFSLVNYQGRLNGPGGPVTDPAFPMTFRFYDAGVGGAIIHSEQHDVDVQDGYFNVVFDQLDPGVFGALEMWLEVEANGEILQPRQQFTSAPYALRAYSADTFGGRAPGNYITDGGGSMSGYSSSPILSISNSANGSGSAVSATISGWLSGAVEGRATNNGDVTNYGGYFEAWGSAGRGTYGAAWGTSGRGVHGIGGNSGDVENYGGYFEAWGRRGRGVHAQATGDQGIGVYGEASSTAAGEVNFGGYFSAGAENGQGVYAEASGANGIGVFGWATDTGAIQNKGGVFEAEGDAGVGVFARASGSSGVGVRAVGGITGSLSTSSAVSGYGVYGSASGDNGKAVYGIANNSGDVENYGGYFIAQGTSGKGVYAYSGSGTGVLAESFWGTAVHAESDGAVALYAKSPYPTCVGCSAGVFEGRVKVVDGTGATLIQMNEWGDGDIVTSGHTTTSVLTITGGSDLSEQFDVRGIEEDIPPAPGMVVSIDPERPGHLRISDGAYDRGVAGIISGAGGIRPGRLMGQSGSVADGANPVALTGRVYCWADAGNGAIEPGDLLTTSETPGHAMKVTDYASAQGAILGKAMSSLEAERGLVLVLVTLQ
jgi:hypothetical protein